eukprot:jgi/Tetstr1/447634/TSEL_034993.t1
MYLKSSVDTPEGYQRHEGQTCNASSMSTHTDGSCQERCSGDEECAGYVEFSDERCKTYASCPLEEADSDSDVAFVKTGDSGSDGGDTPEGYQRREGQTCNASSLSTHTDGSCQERCSGDGECAGYVEFSDERCKTYASCPLEEADSDSDVAFVKTDDSGSDGGDTPEGYQRREGQTCNASSLSTHTDGSCQERCSGDEECVGYVEFSDERCKTYASCPLEEADSDSDVAFVKTGDSGSDGGDTPEGYQRREGQTCNASSMSTHTDGSCQERCSGDEECAGYVEFSDERCKTYASCPLEEADSDSDVAFVKTGDSGSDGGDTPEGYQRHEGQTCNASSMSTHTDGSCQERCSGDGECAGYVEFSDERCKTYASCPLEEADSDSDVAFVKTDDSGSDGGDTPEGYQRHEGQTCNASSMSTHTDGSCQERCSGDEECAGYVEFSDERCKTYASCPLEEADSDSDVAFVKTGDSGSDGGDTPEGYRRRDGQTCNASSMSTHTDGSCQERCSGDGECAGYVEFSDERCKTYASCPLEEADSDSDVAFVKTGDSGSDGGDTPEGYQRREGQTCNASSMSTHTDGSCQERCSGDGECAGYVEFSDERCKTYASCPLEAADSDSDVAFVKTDDSGSDGGDTPEGYQRREGQTCNASSMSTHTDGSCQERCSGDGECAGYVEFSDERCKTYASCPLEEADSDSDVAFVKTDDSGSGSDGGDTPEGYQRHEGQTCNASSMSTHTDGSCQERCSGDEECAGYVEFSDERCKTYASCPLEAADSDSDVAFVKTGDSGSDGGDTPEGYRRREGQTCNASSMSTHTDGSCQERCSGDEECAGYVEFSDERCKTYASCPLKEADSDSDVAFVKTGDSGSDGGDTPEGYQRREGQTCNTSSMSTHTDGSCQERCSGDGECAGYVEFSDERCKTYASCPLEAADSDSDVAFVKTGDSGSDGGDTPEGYRRREGQTCNASSMSTHTDGSCQERCSGDEECAGYVEFSDERCKTYASCPLEEADSDSDVAFVKTGDSGSDGGDTPEGYQRREGQTCNASSMSTHTDGSCQERCSGDGECAGYVEFSDERCKTYASCPLEEADSDSDVAFVKTDDSGSGSDGGDTPEGYQRHEGQTCNASSMSTHTDGSCQERCSGDEECAGYVEFSDERCKTYASCPLEAADSDSDVAFVKTGDSGSDGGDTPEGYRRHEGQTCNASSMSTHTDGSCQERCSGDEECAGYVEFSDERCKTYASCPLEEADSDSDVAFVKTGDSGSDGGDTPEGYQRREGQTCNTSSMSTHTDGSCQERCSGDGECAGYVEFSDERCKTYASCPLEAADSDSDVAFVKTGDSGSDGGDTPEGYRRREGQTCNASSMSTHTDGSCQERCSGDEECAGYVEFSDERCKTYASCPLEEADSDSDVAFVKTGDSGSDGGDTPEGYQRREGQTCNASSMSTHTDGSCQERCSGDGECAGYVEFSDERCKTYASCPLEEADSDSDVAFVKTGDSGSDGGDTPEGYRRREGQTCNASSMSTHTDGSCQERCSGDEECAGYVEFSNRCKLYASCELADSSDSGDVAFVKDASVS